MTEIVKHEQNSVWFDGETMVIRASALGGCMRAMAALASGYDKMEAPDSMQKRFDDGHLHEDSILREMERQCGYPIEASQNDVVLRIKKNLEIRGHVDGLTGNARGEKGVAEAKAFSDGMFKKYLSQGLATFEGYQFQISVYMLGTASTFALYGVKNKNSGDVEVREIDAPPKSLGEIAKRALEIERVVKRAMGGENAALMECDRSQYPCPVFYLHEERPEHERLEGDVILEGLVAAYDKAREEAKVASDRQSVLADEIKMRLGVMGKDRVEVGGFAVTATYGSRSSLDDAALKRDYPGIDIKKYQVKKQNANPTLNVTAKE